MFVGSGEVGGWAARGARVIIPCELRLRKTSASGFGNPKVAGRKLKIEIEIRELECRRPKVV